MSLQSQGLEEKGESAPLSLWGPPTGFMGSSGYKEADVAVSIERAGFTCKPGRPQSGYSMFLGLVHNVQGIFKATDAKDHAQTCGTVSAGCHHGLRAHRVTEPPVVLVTFLIGSPSAHVRLPSSLSV